MGQISMPIGTQDAIARIIQIIMNGLMDETML